MSKRDKAIVDAAEAYIAEEVRWEFQDKDFRNGEVSVPEENRVEWERSLTAHILKSLDLRAKLAQAVAL